MFLFMLVKPEKMEISSQRTGGPSDWLQLCTFFGGGFAMYEPGWLRVRDVSFPLAEAVGRKSTDAAALCSTQAFAELSLRAVCEEKCHVIVLQYVHWVLPWVSRGQSVLMTWIVTQLCCTSVFFNLHQGCRTPGIQRLLLLTAVQSHESAAGWSERSLVTPPLFQIHPQKHHRDEAEQVFWLGE